MTRAGTIPLSEIAAIQIYTGKHRNNKAGLREILQKTGGDMVINGAIFLKSLRPCCHLKAEGEVLCRPGYTTWAVSWNTPADYALRVVPAAQANYMACVKCLVAGQKVKMDHQPDMAYACNRSAVGVKDKQFAYYATEDNLTPEQLQDRLYDLGWSDAIMLDGGGSACIWFADGNGFAGDGRTIPLWLVIRRKREINEPKGEKPMVEIHAYSKKRDGGKKLSANFKVSEFACGDGSDAVLVAPKLVWVLQAIRSHFGKPVSITSGYRTPQHNDKVGGAAQSQHCFGTAADIVVKGVDLAEVAAFARELMPDWGGVGRYDSQGFIHIDVREEQADW